MAGEDLVQIIGIMIVAAAAMVLVLRWAKIPTIVLNMVTGLLLGSLFGVLHISSPDADTPDAAMKAVHIVAEVGIALLLFLVGLELSFDKIRDVGRVALFAGIGQVVFTAIGGFVLAIALRFTVMESIFLATALTFSSTVVVVKLLDQKKELHSLYGRIAVGIFLVQDLVVIIVLTFLAGLGAPESFQPITIAHSLGKAFLGMGAMLAVALLASRYLLARPFAWAAQSPQALVVWSLCWCFVFVSGAELLGLSPEIGAFLAGISLAQLDCSHDLRRRVHPLMNFFIVIFFVSLGAQMELGDALDHWKAGLVLSLFVLIGNPFIFMWIIARCGYGERTSFLTSVTVAQISEFSFIFAAVGLRVGLIDESILSLISIIGIITIAVSAYMILHNHRLYEKVRAWGLLRPFRAPAIEEPDEAGGVDLHGHIIVVGMNALGRKLVTELHARGETVLAVDTDARKLRDLPGRKLVGSIDYTAVVEEAGLTRARLVISALQIEDTNNLLAYRCKQHGVPVAIHAFDRSVIADLERLGVDFLIDPKARGTDRLAEELRTAGVVTA